MRLSGKKALVTGGSRGIGAATALKLAEEGADVAITYSASKEKAEKVVAAITKLGRKAVAIHADANDPAKVAQAVADAAKSLGGLDILVNNAGVFEAGGAIGSIDAEQFEHQLNVNVRSVFAATQAAVQYLKAGGRVVNVSSVLGERAIMPGVSAYTMSKFAVAGLTRGWALDLAQQNITVNAVLPGPIATDMLPDGAEQLSPMKRAGKPEEIANVIAFLASSEASYMTGATVTVDGGVNA